MKKISIFISVFGLLMVLMPIEAEAQTLQDLYNQLAKYQAEYNTNKNNRDLTQAEINKLNNDITNLSASIEQTRKDILQAEVDIENSKKKIEEKKNETDGLLQFLQVSNGGNIYLEYLFDAENYTDFIYRYEVVKQLTNYNSDLIDELNQLILDLQQKESDLKEKKIKLENERKEITTKVNKLTFNLASYKSAGATISDDIQALKKQINAYEDQGCLRNQELSTCSASINAYGWKYPLLKGCVTWEFGGFSNGHFGIDLDCMGEGTNVYAAADGVVERIAFYDCGGNAIYIRHRINGKYYISTYMHLLSISNGIYVGKVVTDQTIIGKMGGYTTSKQIFPNSGYDNCTSGAHLHFGIAEGYSSIGFNSYAINPREIFAFPQMINYGGGYFYR